VHFCYLLRNKRDSYCIHSTALSAIIIDQDK
jgi:hypothetical protein